MSQQHEPLDAHAVQRLRDERGLAGRRSVLRAPRAVAPAVAGAIDQNDPAGLRQPVAERQPEVAEIAAGTVHQHDRPVRIGAPSPCSSLLTEFEDVKPAAIDFDKAARGRVGHLDAPDGERGDPRTDADDGDDGEKHETGHESPTGHSSLMFADSCRFSN